MDVLRPFPELEAGAEEETVGSGGLELADDAGGVVAMGGPLLDAAGVDEAAIDVIATADVEDGIFCLLFGGIVWWGLEEIEPPAM